MKVRFFCRKTKMTKEGLIPIELSISAKGQRKFIATGRKVKPNAFNAKTQKVKGDPETNEFLMALKARLYSIETELLRNGEDITVDSVLSVFKDGDSKKSITILALFELHYDKIRKKVSKKLLAPTTLSKYLVTKDYLIKYLKSEKKVNDILIKNITPNFIEGFFLFLLKSMANNTAVHKMKQLKAVLNMAVEEGYIDVSPFKLELKNEKVEVEPLTVEEITRIKNKQIDIDRLAKIRDLFVFECYTGLAFTDLKTLEEKNFVTDENGKKWIVKKRHKTNIVSTIPLMPVALEILEKYNYRFPMISNVKYNAYLKEIGDICGINKSLHSHLARHSYATMLLNAGLNMALVAKCLGHANTKITESVYAKVLPATISEKMKEVEKKLSDEGAF